MKSAILALAFVCILAQVVIAQQQMQDVVYLKNGSIIRGIIIEQVPNVSIKIQTKDGNIFVYKVEEIERITSEPGEKVRKDVKHDLNEINFAMNISSLRAEGESLTALQFGMKAGRFVSKKIEMGVETFLTKIVDGGHCGSSAVFLSLHFPGTAGSRTLPYIGVEAGLGYSGENSFAWGAYGGMKIFASSGESAVSIQPFYLRQMLRDGSINYYGFLTGISVFF